MLDPFTAWSRIAAAGFDMQRTWLRAAETVEASNSVIAARTAKMRAAAASPLDADFAEFARMVPEKLEAFNRSGAAVAQGMAAMQSAYFAQAQRMGALMTAGRAPTVGELSTFVARSGEYMLGAVDAGARIGKGALAPVHKTATGNARRLRAES